MAATDDIVTPTSVTPSAAAPTSELPITEATTPRTESDTTPPGPKSIITSHWLSVEWRPRPQSSWMVIQRWLFASPRAWWQRVTSPLGAVAIAALLIVGLGGYVMGATEGNGTGSSSASSSSGMSMGSSSGSTTNSNVPNASQDNGNQPAHFVLDSDGAKHFTFTAEQVMWQPLKGGQRVLAWTLDGTVPGPMIRVTAGDHVRVSINNHLPEPTTIHWHGLEIPANMDGVPGVGQDPIKPGTTFTYDFTIPQDNVGTYFYHSHYDDLTQVTGGLYGAFIVDPKPGTSAAQNAPKYDQEYSEIISELGGYYVINGKSFPDTQPINVVHGQNVLVRLINMGEMIHPMHLHGHFFNVVAKDGALLAQPQRADTLTIAPGESDDFIFNAWAAPGSVYPFHCHILAHVMNPGQTTDEMGGLIVLVKYAK